MPGLSHGGGAALPGSQQSPQMARALGRSELAKSLGLDLANALTSDIKFLTDLFQSVLALAADAEAQPDHFLLLRREGLQDIRGFVAYIRIDDGIVAAQPTHEPRTCLLDNRT